MCIRDSYPEDLKEDQPIDKTDELEINDITIQIVAEIKNKLKNIGKVQLADKKLSQIINTIQTNTNDTITRNYHWYNEKLY